MIKGINHITLAVRDIEISFEFYKTVLGFKPVAKWEKAAYLELHDIWLALSLESERSQTADPGYSHIAFTCTESDFLMQRHKILEYGCKEWSQNRSEGDSFYFLDPDGHQLEIHVGDLQTRLKAMKEKDDHKVTYY